MAYYGAWQAQFASTNAFAFIELRTCGQSVATRRSSADRTVRTASSPYTMTVGAPRMFVLYTSPYRCRRLEPKESPASSTWGAKTFPNQVAKSVNFGHRQRHLRRGRLCAYGDCLKLNQYKWKLGNIPSLCTAQRVNRTTASEHATKDFYLKR